MNILKKIEFDENGLIKDFPYIYTEDGLVDWRAILFQKPEFLVANKKNFEKRGESIPINIEEIQDKDLLILLAGVKYIANIRQFLSVKYQVFAANLDFVSCKCRIVWKGNYETSSKDILFESMADASNQNTNSFAKIYLTAIAENRAFVRNVRNMLRIPIIGQDEIGASNANEEETNGTPNNEDMSKHLENLKTLMQEKGIEFDKVKARLIISGVEGAENFKSVLDLPKSHVFDMLEKVKKAKKK